MIPAPMTTRILEQSPTGARAKAWSWSVTLHAAAAGAALAFAGAASVEAGWAAVPMTPQRPLLRDASDTAPAAPSFAGAPPVAAEAPPPAASLVDPTVLPVAEAEPQAEAAAAPPDQPAPTPDWTARVTEARVEETPDQPLATAAPAPAQEAADSVQPSPLPDCNEAPHYPRRAVRERIEGEVTVLLDVDADGRVTAAHVEVSSGSSLLDDAALEQLAKWRFEPARRLGVAVRSTFRKVVEFRLRS